MIPMTLNNPKSLLRTAINKDEFVVNYNGTRYIIQSEDVADNISQIVDLIRTTDEDIGWPELLDIVNAEGQ